MENAFTRRRRQCEVKAKSGEHEALKFDFKALKTRSLAAIAGLCLIVLVPCYAGADDGEALYHSMGIGNSTCGQFAHQYKQNPGLTEAQYRSWMQGWLSGYNNRLLVSAFAGTGRKGEEVRLQPGEGTAQLNKQIINLAPREFDPEQQWNFVLGFCSEAPLKFFSEAVSSVLGILEGLHDN